MSDTTPRIRTAAEILFGINEKMDYATKRSKDTNRRMSNTKNLLINGEEITSTEESITNFIKVTHRRITNARNLYFSNKGKMSHNDEHSDALGEYKMYRAKAKEMEVVQQKIIDTINIDLDSIKIAEEILSILNQKAFHAAEKQNV